MGYEIRAVFVIKNTFTNLYFEINLGCEDDWTPKPEEAKYFSAYTDAENFLMSNDQDEYPVLLDAGTYKIEKVYLRA